MHRTQWSRSVREGECLPADGNPRGLHGGSELDPMDAWGPAGRESEKAFQTGETVFERHRDMHEAACSGKEGTESGERGGGRLWGNT